MKLEEEPPSRGTQGATPVSPAPPDPGRLQAAARRAATHFRRPRMKAWKRLRLLVSGASRLTWPYRVPRERVLEPGDTGAVSQAPARSQPPALPGPTLGPPSPGFTEASTTLQGLLLRCPVMRSFLNGFSPSATRAWRAGQRVVSTRCPTSGLSRLSPSWAWRRHSGCGCRDSSSSSPPRSYIPSSLPNSSHSRLHLFFSFFCLFVHLFVSMELSPFEPSSGPPRSAR